MQVKPTILRMNNACLAQIRALPRISRAGSWENGDSTRPTPILQITNWTRNSVSKREIQDEENLFCGKLCKKRNAFKQASPRKEMSEGTLMESEIIE